MADEARDQSPLVVDIHCHTFNADDIPVRGFVHRVAFDHAALGEPVARLVARVIQGRAPGYAEEQAVLDRLLGEQGFAEAYRIPPAPEVDVVAELEADVKDTLERLQGQDPAFVAQIGAELQAAEREHTGMPADDFGEASVEDALSLVPRAIRWAKVFGRSRLDITRLLIKAFDRRVDLFCPMLVDLDSGLGEAAQTTLAQQVDLQEQISRLSMLGRMGSASGRVHPFVAFDPRREVRARLGKQETTPFDLVQDAVLNRGFIGVKLYPPMGWRPIGNQAALDMTPVEAREVDVVLRKFYRWCEKEQVPITAHCNQGIHAHSLYADYASPRHWTTVLDKHRRLRVNLGHFGGARAKEPMDGWPWLIARAMEKHEHLYADVGNHSVHNQRITDAYFAMLRAMQGEREREGEAKLGERLMLGSDWYMSAIHPENERFLDRYLDLYDDSFGSDATAAFAGKNARSFLGFDDPTNRNCKRLAERYRRYAPERTPTWLAR